MAVTDHEYALLSAYAHLFARDNKENLPDLAKMGFTIIAELNLRNNGIETDGFEGIVVRRGNDIVVAFAGTDQYRDWMEDGLMAFSQGNQLESATMLYVNGMLAVDQLKRSEPDLAPAITFTGHSLGGGLASVMAMLFDKPAVVFDSAPFLALSDSFNGVMQAASVVRPVQFVDPYLRATLNDPIEVYLDTLAVKQGFVPGATPEMQEAARIDYAQRRENISGYHKIGEALSNFAFLPLRIRAEAMSPINLGHGFLTYARDGGRSAWDLHTGTLFNAHFADPKFSEIAQRLWHFLPELFNSKVEERGYSEAEASFLEHVTYSYAPGSNETGNLLHQFLADVDKIQTDVDFYEQEVPEFFPPGDPALAPLDRDGQSMVQYLIQTAIAYYMTKPKDMVDVRPLFEDAGDGALRIDSTRLGTSGARNELGPTSIRTYVEHRIGAEHEANGDSPLNIGRFDIATEWVVPMRSGVQASTTSREFLPSFALGSQAADVLRGAGGNDTLVGDTGADLIDARDAGKDQLYGGEGDDRLKANGEDEVYGGRGYDRYEVTPGVKIKDRDGRGNVKLSGVLLRDGYLKKGTENVYLDRSGDIEYRLIGDKLFIREHGNSTPLVIEGWGWADLDIFLHPNEPDPEDPKDPDPVRDPTRADPLTFDLDGDGLETAGPNEAGAVYFDVLGNGTATLTGWVKPDDGFLALDRNGNGLIDSGQELFGDATPLAFGGLALDGFDALAQEDTNSDGWVDAQDTRFSQLRLWQDRNQDGQSDEGELKGLAELGIEAVRVTNVGNRQELANGNRVADLGTFRYTDGRTGTAGVVGELADIDLGLDLTGQQLPPVAVDPATAALPYMEGNGRVQDLHAAATLSATLASDLASFGTLSRAEQQLAIDKLLYDWARSSDMTPLRERGAAAGIGVVYDQFQRPGHDYYARPGDRPYQSWVEGGGLGLGASAGWVRGYFDAATWKGYEDYFEQRIFTLEAFGGRYFQLLPGEEWPAPSITEGRFVDTTGLTPVLHVSWAANHLGTLVQSRYENLRQQVYDTLVEQTRLASLLAPLEDASLSLQQAYDQIETGLRQRIAANSLEGLGDLIDVNAILARRYGIDPQWKGHELLADTLAMLPSTPELQDLLLSDRIVDTASDAAEPGNPGRYVLAPSLSRVNSIGRQGDDVFIGTGGSDAASGGAGDDELLGRGGDDSLRGDGGDDVLVGGTGNDQLRGGDGDDSYQFTRGEGHDVVDDAQGYSRVRFIDGLRAADLAVERDGADLLIRTGPDSSVRFRGSFDTDGNPTDAMPGVEFDDGSYLDAVDLIDLLDRESFDLPDGRGQTLRGSAADELIDALGGDDTVFGGDGADTLLGSEGRDRLEGEGGADALSGGTDDDLLYGGAGQDTLAGDGGDDQLDGGTEDDLLNGGAGRDSLTGGAGADTFVYALGDGHDRIVDAGAAIAGDAVRFGEGITAAGIRVARSGDDLWVQIGTSSSDKLVLGGWFAAAAAPIDRFEFADGSVLSARQIRNRMGLADSGDDVLAGSNGADTLAGGEGDDLLAGLNGLDTLNGGAGVDTLVGGLGNDTLDGGSGDDVLDAGAGNDTIVFGPGSGVDTLVGVDAATNKSDRVLVSALAADVLLYRAGNDLVIGLRNNTVDRLRVVDHFAPTYDTTRIGGPIERMQFSDGSRWSLSQINARVALWTGPALAPAAPVTAALPVTYAAANLTVPVAGTKDDRTLTGTELANTLNGGEGDDVLSGLAGNDRLNGGIGVDRLDGGDGDDTLTGGAGRDTLTGGAGADTYVFSRGDGSDTVHNEDPSSVADRVRFGTGIAAEDVLVRREADDLVLHVGLPGETARAAATGDAVRIAGFFTPGDVQVVDSVLFANGRTWTSADLKRMVEAASAGQALGVLGAAADSYEGGAGVDIVDAAGGNDTVRGRAGADQLNGGAGNDTLEGGSEDDLLDGGVGNDTLRGDDGDDTVVGGEGNDNLYGGEGSDTLRGGAGVDHVWAGGGRDRAELGAGKDVVHVELSDGQLVVDASDPGVREIDTLRFGLGIRPADVSIVRSGDDLLLQVKDGPTVTVLQHYAGSGDTAATLERIAFDADTTTVWTSATLKKASLTATPGNDRLFGFDDAETINGLAGNDTIDGRKGDDVLIGGAGNDTLTGGEGADTYRFGPGWGQDTIYGGDSIGRRDRIVFEAGIDPASLVLRRQGNDLLVNGAADSLRISGYFDAEGTGTSMPGDISFGDAAQTVWDLAAVRARTLLGTPGDDAINGHASDDTINGGAGNDTLTAGGGNDTYVFERGFGQDRIHNYDPTTGRIDRIRFAGDILPEEVLASRQGSQLTLTVGTDSIALTAFFENDAQGAWRIDELVFDAVPGTVMNTAQIVALSARPTAAGDTLTGTSAADTINALGGNDVVFGLAGDDTLNGDADGDTLYGGAGNDLLQGGAGSDSLQGEAGDDTLDGGAGDDALDGGAGRDVIRFGRGGGMDTVALGTGTDVLDLSTLRRADLRLSRSGNALVVSIADTGEAIQVWEQFAASPRIDELRLADATLDAAAIEAALRTATSGDDALYGGSGPDLVDGLAGNDLLVGQGGDDRLDGGPGNDTLIGGTGNDTFVVQASQGWDTVDATDATPGKVDTIEFGAGVTPESVRVSRDGNDMILTLPGTGNGVRVRNLAAEEGDGPTGIQQLHFADGTVWTPATLRSLSLVGGAGAQSLLGYTGDDLLVGGTGDDTLNGGAGSDTYVYRRGDGNDTLDNADAGAGRIDTLLLDTGIAPADVSLRRVTSDRYDRVGRPLTDDLMVDIEGGGSVRVHHFFTGDGQGGWQIDRIAFADGSPAIDVAAMLAAVRQGSARADLLIGTAGDDLQLGLAGDDTLRGLAGDDTLDGGAGNDSLDGGAGSDTYRFAAGWGRDTLAQNDASITKVDRAVFEGMARADVVFSRDASDLFVTRRSGSDELRIVGFFLTDDQNARQVDEFVFTDRTLTPFQVRELLFTPTDGDDLLFGSANSDVIDGGRGDDVVHGLGGNDALLGGTGNDSLYGEDGEDTLDGGPGDDLLVGGEGISVDIYRFGNGRGADRVAAGSSTVSFDQVQIDAGLAPTQITLLRSFDDLVLGAPDGSTLRLLGFLAGGQSGRVGSVIFADGTVWGPADLIALSGRGSDGDDHMVGDAGDNVFDGRGGNDSLRGNAGNDTLDGGAGDGARDTLDGGIGDDTYLFGLGDGQDDVQEAPGSGSDRVLFRANITADSLSFARSSDDLLIQTAAGDRLRLSAWFAGGSRVERFEFADGSVWSENDVLLRMSGGTDGNDQLTGTNGNDVIDARGGRDSVLGRAGDDLIYGGADHDYQLAGEDGNDTVHGGDGDDYLSGGAGDDRLHGDAGSDTLQSGSGSDVLDGGAGNDWMRGYGDYPDVASGNTLYRFGAGWGQDILQDQGSAGSVDTLEFYGGTLPAALTLRYELNNTLGFTGTLRLTDGVNSVRVLNQLQGTGIEQVRFLDADGAVVDTWDSARIAAEALRATDGNDTIAGTQGADVLQGGAGNDTLVGVGGADEFDGGSGDDLLIGGGSADRYVVRGAFGSDRVRDIGLGYAEIDELVFEGRASTEFGYGRSGDDLLVTDNSAPQNTVRVEKYFLFDGGASGYSQRIETLRFSDVSWDANALIANLSPATEGDDQLTGTSGNDTIHGLGGNDNIRGEAGNDTIDGGDGDDDIDGGLGSDTLRGGAGDDTINDGSLFPNRPASDDVLEGGPGRNRLYGGAGADTYIVTPQTGYDNISNVPFVEAAPDDRLLLIGIDPATVTLQRYSYYDLRVVIGEATGFAQFGTYFIGNLTYYQLARMEFSDGTVWDTAEITARASRTTRFDDIVAGNFNGLADNYDAGDGNDVMYGLGGPDTLRGGNGDDRLYAYSDGSLGFDAALLAGDAGNDFLDGGQLAEGGDGNDVLRYAIEQRGGRGNDELIGGTQTNTFRFARGDGQDTLRDQGNLGEVDHIVFDAGITRSDVSLRSVNGVLTLDYGSGDRIGLIGGVVENVQFADGSSVTMAELLATLPQPTEGDDLLVGSGADDTIDGLGGNDDIDGGGGSDTLLGGAGDDRLAGGRDPYTEDLLDGGIGRDELDGSDAATRYRYRPGDGGDYIIDHDGGFFGQDVLDVRLTADSVGTSLSLWRVGDDLSVRLGAADTTDRVLVEGWFLDDHTGIDAIELHDEYDNLIDSWDRQRIAAEAVVDPGDGPTGPTDGDDDLSLGGGDDTLDALEGNDTVRAFGGNDTVHGGGGNDSLFGGDGDDKLYGNDGDDTLDGSGGVQEGYYDELDGGEGSDLLISSEGSGFFNGGNGADTYRIGAGGGGRFVFEGVPNEPGDVVELDASLSPALLQVDVDGNGVMMRRSDDTSWSVLLWGLLDPALGVEAHGVDGPVETVRLSHDGSTLTPTQLRAMLPGGAWVRGGTGDDGALTGNAARNSIWGQAGHDTMLGEAGDDWLYGGAGDDIHIGGTGNDWLEDRGGGSDTYRFQRGDGSDYILDTGPVTDTDRVVFGPGIAAADVELSLQGNGQELRLLVRDGSGQASGDELRVLSWGDGEGTGRIERVEFDDGTVWSAAQIDGFLAGGAPLSVAEMADATAAFMVAGDEQDMQIHAERWLDKPGVLVYERVI